MAVEVENTCYECGCEISSDVHFCNEIDNGEKADCNTLFFNRYGHKKALAMLGRQTKYRKKGGLPCYNKNGG